MIQREEHVGCRRRAATSNTFGLQRLQFTVQRLGHAVDAEVDVRLPSG